MFVGSFFVFVTILTSVYGTCQSLDGQSVPWWILYQQKERPFFHQYVESTNSHRVKEHYPERRDSVLSRVMSSVIDKEEAEYIIYSSDLVNVKDIAGKTSIPTYSKWMHGILGTTSSWKSGFWILHNNLLFPALTNGALSVPGSKAWYATTVGDSSADLFYICLTAENKGNITEMLISIMAGNPFIYKKKLQNYDFLQPYLKEVRPLQTSFGYEMSASMFLNCMYASSNNVSTNCLFTFAVTTGVGLNIFTRPRGMIKHSSAFCYDEQSFSLFDFLKVEERSTLKTGFSHSMFVLSGKTGTTCFGQDVAANAETVAVMICANLPNVYGTIIKSARLTQWSCRPNKYNSGKEKHRTQISNFPVIKQTTFSKPQDASNEGENSELTAQVADDADEKNVSKFCQMYDCEINDDNQNEAEFFDNHSSKNLLLKNQKIANWFRSMVADIEMQNNIEHPRKTKKMFKKKSNAAIKVKGLLEVSRFLLKNEKAVLALFCQEGCRFCQNAREQFILLASSIQTDYLDFLIVNIQEPALPDYLDVPYTPYIRYKFSGVSEWIDYSGEDYDIIYILEFLHTSNTAHRSGNDDYPLSDERNDETAVLSLPGISERKRRETREVFKERSDNKGSTKEDSLRIKREIHDSFKIKHIWQYDGLLESIKRSTVQAKLDQLNTQLIAKKQKSRTTNTFLVTNNEADTERNLINITNIYFQQNRFDDQNIEQKNKIIEQKTKKIEKEKKKKKKKKKKQCSTKEKNRRIIFHVINITDIDAILVHATYVDGTFMCGVFTTKEIVVGAFIKNGTIFIHHFDTKPKIEDAAFHCQLENAIGDN